MNMKEIEEICDDCETYCRACGRTENLTVKSRGIAFCPSCLKREERHKDVLKQLVTRMLVSALKDPKKVEYPVVISLPAGSVEFLNNMFKGVPANIKLDIIEGAFTEMMILGMWTLIKEEEDTGGTND